MPRSLISNSLGPTWPASMRSTSDPTSHGTRTTSPSRSTRRLYASRPFSGRGAPKVRAAWGPRTRLPRGTACLLPGDDGLSRGGALDGAAPSRPGVRAHPGPPLGRLSASVTVAQERPPHRGRRAGAKGLAALPGEVPARMRVLRRNVYASLAGARRAGMDYAHAWRSRYFLGQELAFDLDPENLDCPIHGDIADKMRRGQGLSFCDWEFEEVRRQAAELHDELSRRWTRLRVIYSGRGFHIHVLDEDGFRLNRRDRGTIARTVARRYAIDEWVTSGEMRLIRLPYSLHGMVSRVVIPVDRSRLERFRYDDPRARPRGLHP